MSNCLDQASTTSTNLDIRNRRGTEHREMNS